MEEIVKTLPQHKCSWLKDRFVLYKYQDFWSVREFLEGQILAQQSFKARPSDHVFLCSHPKTGMTWLKALAFAIVTRDKYDGSSSPLLTTMPHGIVPFLEEDHEKIEENHNDLCYPLVGTHLPYNSLPESILASNCKIVYIYRNIKDVIVSYYHFMRKVAKLPMEDAPFEEAFDEFYQGVSWSGPYWDHILGYWKASLEKPETTLFLKYEDLKKDPINNVKRLAEFIGYPFTIEEEKAGVIETIVKLCSFENLSNLEVNKSGKSSSSKKGYEGENRIFFRKATDGDWKNYFTDEMIEKIDKLVDQKLDGTGLVLK